MSIPANKISENILCDALLGLELWENDELSLDDYLDRHLSAESQRRTVSDILFNYFRHKTLIDGLIESNSRRQAKPGLRRILSTVITQCLFQTGIAPESAVNVAVSVSRRRHGRPAGGFVNAVMRNILRCGIESIVAAEPAGAEILPAPIRQRWEKIFSTAAMNEFAQALLKPVKPSFRLCGNIPEEELATIDARKIDGLDWLDGLRFYECGQTGELLDKKWLETGLVYVQDPASALAPLLARPKPDAKVLDLCAAPGGKSLIISEKLDERGSLVAADRSERRQELTRRNFHCRGLTHRIITGNAWELALAAASFDIVLADVPCSNTGVFRRRPDALWRSSESRLASLKSLQRQILAAAAKYVAPGGKLIYSTCSIETEENHLQIQFFLQEHTNFELAKEHQLLPGEKHDGAYAALLTKRKN